MSKKSELLIKWTDFKISSLHTCKYCGEEFPLFDLEKEMLDKHGFKYRDYCSECNFKLLNIFINNKYLYHRKDSKSNKKLISLISEDFEWDVIDVNDYKKLLVDDFAIKFQKDLWDDIFSDFYELVKSFPKPSRLTYPSVENWEYSSDVWWCKNVYLSHCIFYDCENIFYSFNTFLSSKNIYSSYSILNSSNIYFSRNASNSHNIFNCFDIWNSSDLLYCRGMNNCKNCIFSCNQTNKSYLIFNKQYNKEEYQKLKTDILEKLSNKKWEEELLERYEKFLQENLVQQSLDMINAEKSVWEGIIDSKNVINCFGAKDTENCINVMNIWSSNLINNNICNSTKTWDVENSIWSISFWWNTYEAFYSLSLVESKNIYYSIDIESSEECMFCIWLRAKKYHILNKWYSKDQYFFIKEKLISKLKKEWTWWEPLSHHLSPYPYNDTLAYDFYKVNKIIYSDSREEIIDKDAKWIITLNSNDFISDWTLDLWWKEKIKIKWRTKDKEINIPENASTIESKQLPSIQEVDNSILDKVIICEKSKRPYRIMPSELNFLKKYNLALPTLHNDLRIDKLRSYRPIWQMHLWVCDKCNKECLTVFKNKTKYRVYCSGCYREFMYG